MKFVAVGDLSELGSEEGGKLRQGVTPKMGRYRESCNVTSE